ncbi:MAG TPA: proteasome accessory factor PafA2 family protein, partial [Acidimicrobiia bacterium]|nr:proteasome accessory factor PafA2 family protein [Acidimicrobiia bacterium]
MDRRIFGLENEYGVTCTLRGQRRLSPDEVARYLFRRVVSWGRSSNVFLENGARLYLDVGSHPEYATPECDDLEDVVAHDKAGERILEGLVSGAEERLEEEGIRGEIYVFKNNTDSAGNSYGCHENYLVSRHKDFHRTVDVLIPFLVTRQIFVGAGKLTQTPRGTGYTVAQRADHIWEGVSSATTRSRPIINTRDEPHADAERYRRLHVIAGDSNMSEYATYVKVGTMVALLQMIERDVVFRDLTLENPIRAIREVSHDMSCRRKVRLANGREASALEIQREYFEKAARFVDRRDDFGHSAEVLIPVLVSRQIYAGAGKILQTARGAMYCVSQRAEHIWEGVSSATTRSRPIINTRDEPHADAERYRRLHVIVGDSNMSEYTTFLKVGATSILLRMLEDPSVVLRELTLENPIRAIREISHDIT